MDKIADLKTLDELLEQPCKTLEVDHEQADNLFSFEDRSIDDELVKSSILIEENKNSTEE